MTKDLERGRARLGEQERAATSTGTNGRQAGPAAGSSRDSLAGAGWTCRKAGKFGGLVPPKSRPFSWLSPAPLWRSRNQIVGHLLGDPTDDERRRWMKLQRQAGKLQPDLIIGDHADLEEFSFLVVGDTGEGDTSQFAVVPPLLEVGRDTAFMVICSDVIYPSGDAEEYEDKFYRPYKNYPGPIYALPGNHDWYDGLNGFMYHLCGAEAQARGRASEPVMAGTDYRGAFWRDRLRERLWRKPTEMAPTVPTRRRVWRPSPAQRSGQRSPYFAIQTGPLLIVGIDTGMSGGIDREQGEWLRKVSREIDMPKLLLTGKPIYVDGEYHPGAIEGGGTVDEIVREPVHRYVAAIGGDVHNYQRYEVRVEGHAAPIYYIVSGGGGAYMSATHKIPRVSLPGIDEEDKGTGGRSAFVCYPRRGDSLSFYSKQYDRLFGLGRGWLEIPRTRRRRTWGSGSGSCRSGRGTRTRTSAGAPDASPSGSSRCRVAARAPCTTTSPSSSTGTNRRCSRTSCGSTSVRASFASVASPRRVAWSTKRTLLWRTRSLSPSARRGGRQGAKSRA